eukprot:TRINITY_DN8090_c1_g4_i1.p1 TRINITY_DN8090_c1_g4~~TRINITY_DN8090_c1_g4_i1.p1  ORF type:complete len:922 (+),score=247.03 TRINITY_DN8090_c1_g4_i1:54-2768(+)
MPGEVERLDKLINEIDSEEKSTKEHLQAAGAAQRDRIRHLSRDVTHRKSVVGAPPGPRGRRMSSVQRRASVIMLGGDQDSEDESAKEMEEMKDRLQQLEKDFSVRESTWGTLLKKKGDQLLLVMRREQLVTSKMKSRISDLEEQAQSMQKELTELRERNRELGDDRHHVSGAAAATHAASHMTLGHQRVMEVQRSQNDLLWALQRAVHTARGVAMGERSRVPGVGVDPVAAYGLGGAAGDFQAEYQRAAKERRQKELAEKLHAGVLQMAQLMRQQSARLRAQMLRFKQNIGDECTQLMHQVATFGRGKGAARHVVRVRSLGVQCDDANESETGSVASPDVISVPPADDQQPVHRQSALPTMLDPPAMKTFLRKTSQSLLPPLRDLRAAVQAANSVGESMPPVPGLRDIGDGSAAGLRDAGQDFVAAVGHQISQCATQVRQAVRRGLGGGKDGKPSLSITREDSDMPVTHDAFKDMVLWVREQVEATSSDPEDGERKLRLERALQWAQRLIQEGDRLQHLSPNAAKGRRATRKPGVGKKPTAKGGKRARSALSTPRSVGGDICAFDQQSSATPPELQIPLHTRPREEAAAADNTAATRSLPRQSHVSERSADRSEAQEGDAEARRPSDVVDAPGQSPRQFERRVSESGVYCVLCGSGPHYFRSDGDPCPTCGAGLQVSAARRFQFQKKRRARSASVGGVHRGMDTGGSGLQEARLECLQQVLFDFNVWQGSSRTAGAGLPQRAPSPRSPSPANRAKRTLVGHDQTLRSLCQETLMRAPTEGTLLSDEFKNLVSPKPMVFPRRPSPIREPERPPTNQVTRLLREYCANSPKKPHHPPILPSIPRRLPPPDARRPFPGRGHDARGRPKQRSVGSGRRPRPAAARERADDARAPPFLPPVSVPQPALP